MKIGTKLSVFFVAMGISALSTGCVASSPDESETVGEAQQEIITSYCYDAYRSSYYAVNDAYLAVAYASSDGSSQATIDNLNNALALTIETRDAALMAASDPTKANAAKAKAAAAAAAFVTAAPGIVGFWAQKYEWSAYNGMGDVQSKEYLCDYFQ